MEVGGKVSARLGCGGAPTSRLALTLYCMRALVRESCLKVHVCSTPIIPGFRSLVLLS